MFTCLKIRSFNLKILKMMLIVHVHVHVKEGCEEAFHVASLENARNSVQEPGVARFDVCQQNDDPTRFVLVEVYRDDEAPVAHKETAHYRTWRDTVADMMAEPRQAVKFSNSFPDDDGW
jgi:quinol monooxygenase YgiN|tara:strand:- start:224 stop:580 length:357 start_codon:yes stop_codon:yes gene_type:complete